VVKAGDVVLVESFVLRGFQVGGQALEAAHAEEVEQPLVEHQPLLEAQGPLGGFSVYPISPIPSPRHIQSLVGYGATSGKPCCRRVASRVASLSQVMSQDCRKFNWSP
jgi:hypothetical protein